MNLWIRNKYFWKMFCYRIPTNFCLIQLNKIIFDASFQGMLNLWRPMFQSYRNKSWYALQMRTWVVKRLTHPLSDCKNEKAVENLLRKYFFFKLILSKTFTSSHKA